MANEWRFIYSGDFYKIDRIISIETELVYFKEFLLDHPLKPFRTEWFIFDRKYKIAGTVDCICRDGAEFDLYDWKRSKNASPNEKVWRKSINGLYNIPDISYYHYALQLNVYKYILEKNYSIHVRDMYIVVFHPDYTNYQLHKIPEMDNEVQIMLATYK